MRHKLPETFKYAKLWTRNGKMTFEVVEKTVDSALHELWHYNYHTISQMVKSWDAIGRGYGKYRYFLITPDFKVDNYAR